MQPKQKCKPLKFRDNILKFHDFFLLFNTSKVSKNGTFSHETNSKCSSSIAQIPLGPSRHIPVIVIFLCKLWFRQP